MEALDLIAAFCIGGAATFAFVATGGVGMITTPSLIFLGLSPQAAIATDLFALLGGRLGGFFGLWRDGKADLRLSLRLSVMAMLGAVGGAMTLLAVEEALMKRLLGGFLLLMLVLLLARPRLGVEASATASSTRNALGHALFVPVGFWGTFVGAGFLNLGGAVLLFVFRRTFLETAGALTIVGLSVGLVALGIYGAHGAIDWPLGFAMLAGKSLGGYFGGRYAVRAGEGKVRLLFVAVVLVSALRLLL